MSFRKISKNNSLRCEPCGTPEQVKKNIDNDPLKDTACDLFRIYESTQQPIIYTNLIKFTK